MTTERRTQAERRAATRAAVLESACKLFGRKGYNDTSLEEIGAAAGVTIRPIYHYFGSKLDLFRAVNDVMEERILGSLQESEHAEIDAWRRYMALCEEPEFRRIVLIDGPNVLGRERWATSPVTRTVASRFGGDASSESQTDEDIVAGLAARMLIGALAEAAIAIGESEDPTWTGSQAEGLVSKLFSALLSSQSTGPQLSDPDVRQQEAGP